MQLVRKFRVCFITFILVISTFSFLFINPNTVKAQDPFEGDGSDWSYIAGLLGGFFQDILSSHPYRFIRTYYVEETLNITGDVVFNL